MVHKPTLPNKILRTQIQIFFFQRREPFESSALENLRSSFWTARSSALRCKRARLLTQVSWQNPRMWRYSWSAGTAHGLRTVKEARGSDVSSAALGRTNHGRIPCSRPLSVRRMILHYGCRIAMGGLASGPFILLNLSLMRHQYIATLVPCAKSRRPYYFQPATAGPVAYCTSCYVLHHG